jgi:hypothetical protein
MKWELKQLEEAVRNAHGDSYGDGIHQPLQSFRWENDMAYLHACEAEHILKDAISATPGIGTDDSESIAACKAVLVSAAPGDDGRNLRAARFKAEAHIIASAQALHSLGDIMFHVV